ncbi:hypothetical protein ACFC06_21700 [Nocardia sp. NPDC056064]|uniref:hypothetical protein n=1 Tax=Nocardia sp. NPDC056064 TaxID=3345701 RepID=UPI0035DC8DEA
MQLLPLDVQAWQLLYRTTGADGRPYAAVTTVMIPAGAGSAETGTVGAAAHNMPATTAAVSAQPRRPPSGRPVENPAPLLFRCQNPLFTTLLLHGERWGRIPRSIVPLCERSIRFSDCRDWYHGDRIGSEINYLAHQ